MQTAYCSSTIIWLPYHTWIIKKLTWQANSFTWMWRWYGCLLKLHLVIIAVVILVISFSHFNESLHFTNSKIDIHYQAYMICKQFYLDVGIVWLPFEVALYWLVITVLILVILVISFSHFTSIRFTSFHFTNSGHWMISKHCMFITLSVQNRRCKRLWDKRSRTAL